MDQPVCQDYRPHHVGGPLQDRVLPRVLDEAGDIATNIMQCMEEEIRCLAWQC